MLESRIPLPDTVRNPARRPSGPFSLQAWSWMSVLLLAVLALYQLGYLAVYLAQQRGGAERMFGDFFAFWSFARFSHSFPADRIYDLGALQTFQQALPGGFRGFYPYPYPPIFLLYLWPLGALGYLPALALWSGGTLAAYIVAVVGHDWRSPRPWIAIAAPTTLLAVISGQNGLLSAALMIGGLRILRRRPLLGGLLLGGLAFKPQLFVLAPLALIASRQWRGLLGLTASAVGLSAASVAAFGVEVWLRWFEAIPTLSQLVEANRERLSRLMPTLMASLLDAGAGRAPAEALQGVAAAAVIASLWLIFRRRPGAPRPLDAAALQVGVFLVTPYAFIYDMPMVADAVTTALAEPAAPGRGRPLAETVILLAVLALPLIMMSGIAHGWPVGPVLLALAFMIIARQGAASA